MPGLRVAPEGWPRHECVPNAALSAGVFIPAASMAFLPGRHARGFTWMIFNIRRLYL
jgi:hypothetical protein